MKCVVRFQAEDGTEFDTEDAASKHDALCAEIAAVMALLPARPDLPGCRFLNGHGYLQHTPGEFWRVREELLRIGNRLMPHKWFASAISNQDVHPSYPYRLISETSEPLSKAFYRILCTDEKLREWGQPYFAEHCDDRPPEDMVNLRPATLAA